MSYQCPVCGYNKMTHPPEDYYICPSCGTEFENDDFETTHTELRQMWLDNGAEWFSEATPKPYRWNAYSQLEEAGFISVTPYASTATSYVAIKVGQKRSIVSKLAGLTVTADVGVYYFGQGQQEIGVVH
jgi:DNA-directed RNA polymerase subunit RPC12/RpoP